MCIKVDKAVFALGKDALILGVVLGELDEGLTHTDMVVLIGTHEAADFDLAGQTAILGEGGGFRTEHHGDLLPNRNGAGSFHMGGFALDGQCGGIALQSQHLAAQEVRFANEIRNEFRNGVEINFLRGASEGGHSPKTKKG